MKELMRRIEEEEERQKLTQDQESGERDTRAQTLRKELTLKPSTAKKGNQILSYQLRWKLTKYI